MKDLSTRPKMSEDWGSTQSQKIQKQPPTGGQPIAALEEKRDWRSELDDHAIVALADPQGLALAGITGGSETILLVEDELFVRQLMALWLRKLGYTVLEASEGLEALKIWEEHHQRVALLLTDVKMPGQMTGLDLAARLRQEKNSLKVISSSGYSVDLEDFPLAVGEEITHLPKPFTPAALAKAVRHCLDKA